MQQLRNREIYRINISVIILLISPECFSFAIKHLRFSSIFNLSTGVDAFCWNTGLMMMMERWRRDSIGVYRKWHQSVTNVNWSIRRWRTGRSNEMKHVPAREIHSHWLLTWFRPIDIDSEEHLNCGDFVEYMDIFMGRVSHRPTHRFGSVFLENRKISLFSVYLAYMPLHTPEVDAEYDVDCEQNGKMCMNIEHIFAAIRNSMWRRLPPQRLLHFGIIFFCCRCWREKWSSMPCNTTHLQICTEFHMESTN